MSHRIPLREINHPDCLGTNCPDRDHLDGDGLCKRTASKLDGLPVRCVGDWAYDKIYRLVQYFGIFANGMKNRWGGRLNYVEICSGPGRCITRGDHTELDGTALAVIQSPHFKELKKAIFIDASPRVVDILNQRIQALGATHVADAVVGDYGNAPGICRILDRLPDSCLNLVFIDPTNCDAPFTTIQRIVAHLQNADLLINVALGTDVNRNLVRAITLRNHQAARAKYESFLGTPGFCSQPEVIELAKRKDHDDLRRKFADTYDQKLRGEGYQYTNVCPVKHYYYLLFASRNPKGLEFWQKACTYSPDNQKQLL
ncbi:MAG TPA: three-Cys-motif partner protein TcmP [Candidatus Paceibacterota bacterium]|nr:three-Cys-motif partner protein TcmP [Verrucomicrobiota bacterium]HSA12253.1 three-Cys-motif partner protein TcmP [Candidatus Paceibacterota bacterium]